MRWLRLTAGNQFGLGVAVAPAQPRARLREWIVPEWSACFAHRIRTAKTNVFEQALIELHKRVALIGEFLPTQHRHHHPLYCTP